MAWSTIKSRQLFLNLFLLSTFLTSFTSAEHHKRYISSTDHYHHQQHQHIQTQSAFDPQKLQANKDDFSTETTSEMRVSHGLMGGHKKITSTTQNIQQSSEEQNADENQDDDQARWDDGLLLSSAGNGKEKKANHDEDDDKKTLAQQVKEGKYGLIQNEIYSNKPKRPGIISYMSNPDVPKDNIKNLGGLEKEDIWLAENHLLVLKGGQLSEQDSDEPNGDLQGWDPIDDYQAPKRQVRIPSKPDVPPPFPVQLTEGGPIKIIGKNESDNSETGSQWIEGLIPFNSTNLAFSDTPNNETTDESTERRTKTGIFGGLVGPFFPHLPPGTVFVPPPNNQTADYDEDDQSIYYPPPYSFKYSQDNSTAVPPGPLVPGIILPPPPDFFTEEKKLNKTVQVPNKCIRCNSATISNSKTSPKLVTKTYKVSSSTASAKETIRPFTMKPINKLKYKVTSYTENPGKNRGNLIKYTEKPIKYIAVTTPSTKLNSIEISDIQPVKTTAVNQVLEPKLMEKQKWNGGYNKSRPIVAYYPTTTPPNYSDSVEATPVSLKTIINERKPGNNLASYYFYEEASSESTGTTSNPTVYFQETTESPFYKDEVLTQTDSEKKKSYYNIQITPSQQTAEEYSVEVLEPIIKQSPKYQYSASPPTQLPRVQGQRMLSETSPLYYQTVTERPQYSIPSIFTPTTPRGFSATSPTVKFSHKTKSKPIYQYSFEATNYPQQPRTIYKQQVAEVSPKQVTFNEWPEIQEEPQVYDYSAVGSSGDDEPITENYNTKNSNWQSRGTTPNPTHAYYTKQDEQFFDDVTKEYFTNFGKKIKHRKLASTTPIYGKSSSVTERPARPPSHNSYITNGDYEPKQTTASESPKVKVYYGDQSSKFPLKDDVRVNYQHPLPPINPDAEFLPGYSPKPHSGGFSAPIRNQPQPSYHYSHQPNLQRQRLLPIISYNNQHQISQQTDRAPTSYLPLSDSKDDNRNYLEQPISLAGDVAVNYHNPRPPINPDAEFINPTTGNHAPEAADTQPRSYFTYRLPGDGGHVYFFTPVIAQRQDGYRNSRGHGSRSPRRRRGPGGV